MHLQLDSRATTTHHSRSYSDSHWHGHGKYDVLNFIEFKRGIYENNDFSIAENKSMVQIKLKLNEKIKMFFSKRYSLNSTVKGFHGQLLMKSRKMLKRYEIQYCLIFLERRRRVCSSVSTSFVAMTS